MKDHTPQLVNNSKAYADFLKEVKNRIVNTRTQIINSSSRLLVNFYWWLGEFIVNNQEKYGWGKNVVERLSGDLKQYFPNAQGFSPQNLWYMRQLYIEYKNYPDLQRLVGEIPWGQNLTIIGKVKDLNARLYYLNAVREMGWTRPILINQIKANAYERHKSNKKLNNFKKALPKHLAEQANDTMKDFYILDMLGISEPVLEAELEHRMVDKIKDVMLELGYGFTFIANQYRLFVNEHEYFIDLLLFNRKLNSLVAVELKTGKFKPEHAGKMNFYLSLLDEYVREEGENPAIGIILCADHDQFEVEFSLRGLDKAMGVAEYQLVSQLPKIFKDKLPNAKQIVDKIRLEAAQSAKKDVLLID